MKIIVTLAERDYIYGAVVLFNSLVVNGFDGLFVIGYRNRFLMPSLPLLSLESCSQVCLIELDTPIHFTNYKPLFMQHVLSSYPGCTSITYLDPDIVVDCPTNWFLSWCENGPAVCADVNYFMSSTHPLRRQWIEITGLPVMHNLDIYFNGGFLGLLRSDRQFLDNWAKLIEDNANPEIPLNVTGEISEWRKGGRWLPFMAIDQDALNIAVMTWQGSITTLGPDVMGFAGPGIIPHALGTPKPWQNKYLRSFLLGKAPRQVDKLFWFYANSHLRSFPRVLISYKLLSLRIVSFFCRFYKKH